MDTYSVVLKPGLVRLMERGVDSSLHVLVSQLLRVLLFDWRRALLQNWVNDLQFLTRILTFQRISLTKSETKKIYTKSDPIFRCTTPSTGQIVGEVVVGTLYNFSYYLPCWWCCTPKYRIRLSVHLFRLAFGQWNPLKRALLPEKRFHAPTGLCVCLIEWPVGEEGGSLDIIRTLEKNKKSHFD